MPSAAADHRKAAQKADYDLGVISLVDNLAVEWNAKLLKQKPCVLVLACRSVNDDV